MSKKSWTLVVNKDGSAQLPPDLILHIRNMYGLKSKKRRFIKKALKYYLDQAVEDFLAKHKAGKFNL
jgi:hypothetical protein